MSEKKSSSPIETFRPPLGSWGFIIPAIDIIQGKCVRLTKGDYEQKKVYNEFPLEVAKEFEDAGLKRLHLVDLDGAKAGEVKNWKTLEQISSKTNLVIDFSGGISSKKNVSICFDSGAAYAAVGSIAVSDEKTLTEWLLEFGVQKFIIGADVKDEKLAIKGWTETTEMAVFDLIENYKTKGVKQFFCTDISKDGLLQGTGIDLYKKILNLHPSIDLIASGGVSSIDDLLQLREAGCSGAIVGKAIYEKKNIVERTKAAYMISLNDFLLFAFASMMLNITPGNDMLYVATRSTSQGVKAGIVSALGITGGCIVHLLAAVIGLSAIIANSAIAFDIIKYAGAAYLIYLGVRSFLSKQNKFNISNTVEKKSLSKLFWQGVFTNVLNPKVALFFLAFLPQFIHPEQGDTALQILLLGLWFNISGTIVNIIVAMLFGRLGNWLGDKQAFVKWQNKITGLLLVGLGIKVALSQENRASKPY